MDTEKDQAHFWVAREGLKAPLPKDWKPCKTKDTEEIYYFNFTSGESTWDHPCDDYYRKMYEDSKKKAEQENARPKDKDKEKKRQEKKAQKLLNDQQSGQQQQQAQSRSEGGMLGPTASLKGVGGALSEVNSNRLDRKPLGKLADVHAPTPALAPPLRAAPKLPAPAVSASFPAASADADDEPAGPPPPTNGQPPGRLSAAAAADPLASSTGSAAARDDSLASSSGSSGSSSGSSGSFKSKKFGRGLGAALSLSGGGGGDDVFDQGPASMGITLQRETRLGLDPNDLAAE